MVLPFWVSWVVVVVESAGLSLGDWWWKSGRRNEIREPMARKNMCLTCGHEIHGPCRDFCDKYLVPKH